MTEVTVPTVQNRVWTCKQITILAFYCVR